MNNFLSFRGATGADIPAMSAIRLAVLENTLSDPARITRQMYEDYLDRLGNSWVCERDGAIAGFASADRHDGSIWALFVDPEHEGQGIGRILLTHATGYLFGLGHQEITLSTGAGTRADRFYASLGWTRGAMEDARQVLFTLPRSAA